jgi:hypothetical protein
VMSTAQVGNDAIGDTAINRVLGPTWSGTAHRTNENTTGALTLFGGSEYLSVGQMVGDRGNTLTVYMDRWGGSAANYIVAPEMVFSWPETWGDIAAGVLPQQSITQTSRDSIIPCFDGCPDVVPNTPSTSLSICVVNCSSGTEIEVESVPEPATVWLVGACAVTLLLWRRMRHLCAWRWRRT